MVCWSTMEISLHWFLGGDCKKKIKHLENVLWFPSYQGMITLNFLDIAFRGIYRHSRCLETLANKCFIFWRKRASWKKITQSGKILANKIQDNYLVYLLCQKHSYAFWSSRCCWKKEQKGMFSKDFSSCYTSRCSNQVIAVSIIHKQLGYVMLHTVKTWITTHKLQFWWLSQPILYMLVIFRTLLFILNLFGNDTNGSPKLSS